MDIRDHLNLIDNHGYKGHIAIYSGPELMTSIKHGDVVLVEHDGNLKPNHNRWVEMHRTVEMPCSEESIRNRDSLFTTHSCCVGVPRGYLRSVRHLWLYLSYYWVGFRIQNLLGHIDRCLFT